MWHMSLHLREEARGRIGTERDGMEWMAHAGLTHGEVGKLHLVDLAGSEKADMAEMRIHHVKVMLLWVWDKAN